MYKAILFDLDGTLTNTLEGLKLCVNHTMDEMGLPHITLDQARKYIGNGAKVLLQKSLIAVCGTDDRLDEADRIYGAFFKEHCCDGVSLYPGVLDLLLTLKEKGFILAVVTNKPHEASCIVIKNLIGNNVFSVVRGQIDGKPRKPEPAIIDEVVDQLNLSKEDCLFVGDSEVDVTTGLNARIDTVLCRWGFRSEKELIDAGAKNLVSTADELKDFILSK